MLCGQIPEAGSSKGKRMLQLCAPRGEKRGKKHDIYELAKRSNKSGDVGNLKDLECFEKKETNKGKGKKPVEMNTEKHKSEVKDDTSKRRRAGSCQRTPAKLECEEFKRQKRKSVNMLSNAKGQRRCIV